MTNRRFLSLWLPRLATDRARRAHRVDAAAPLAAVATVKNARRLVGVDANAARLGLTRRPDARRCARAPSRARRRRGRSGGGGEAARAPRRRSARATRRSSRSTARDGLMLDVSGVAHLFGGEEGLLAEIETRFRALGVRARARPRRHAARRLGARAPFEPAHRARRPRRQGLRQTVSRHAGRRARARRGRRRRHGARGAAPDRRSRDAAARADRRALRRRGHRAARRAERPRARRDLAALRRARFFRRAAFRQPDRRTSRR